jgi:hypothetical protein
LSSDAEREARRAETKKLVKEAVDEALTEREERTRKVREEEEIARKKKLQDEDDTGIALF